MRNADHIQTIHASSKKVRKKSRECHNHKPQPFPDPERKRKPTNLNKHKPNKRAKSTEISNLYYNSFFPSTIRTWNSLSDEIKSAPNVAAFKYCLNENLRKPPGYFSCGTRLGQVLHARLRLECSSLNSHLYSKNIIESPSCSCGGFESNYHYLFICPNYANHRNRYLSHNLQNYSANDLLYGKESLSEHDNESLFLQVQEYIIKSGRFNPT